MKVANGLRKSDVLPAFQALLGKLFQCGYGQCHICPAGLAFQRGAYTVSQPLFSIGRSKIIPRDLHIPPPGFLQAVPTYAIAFPLRLMEYTVVFHNGSFLHKDDVSVVALTGMHSNRIIHFEFRESTHDEKKHETRFHRRCQFLAHQLHGIPGMHNAAWRSTTLIASNKTARILHVILKIHHRILLTMQCMRHHDATSQSHQLRQRQERRQHEPCTKRSDASDFRRHIHNIHRHVHAEEADILHVVTGVAPRQQCMELPRCQASRRTDVGCAGVGCPEVSRRSCGKTPAAPRCPSCVCITPGIRPVCGPRLSPTTASWVWSGHSLYAYMCSCVDGKVHTRLSTS